MSNKVKASAALSLFAAFPRKDDGAATIEFVLWLPVMAFLLGLVADTAMIFGGQAQVLRVVQNANRATSIGLIRSAEDTQRAILDGIVQIAPNASVTTSVNGGLITSTVLIPVTDLTATGLVDAFTDFNVAVFAQHLSES